MTMTSGTRRVPEVLIGVVIAGFLWTGSLAFLPHHHLAFRHHQSQPNSHTKAHQLNQQPTWETSQQCESVSTIDDSTNSILTRSGPVGASRTAKHNNKDLATVVSSFLSQCTTFTISAAMTVLLCTSTMSFGTTNTIAWAADTAETSSVLLQGSPKQQPRRNSLVDEVGGLIDKYFVDRTYNKQVCFDVLANKHLCVTSKCKCVSHSSFKFPPLPLVALFFVLSRKKPITYIQIIRIGTRSRTSIMN